jgi:hypothetical protein
MAAFFILLSFPASFQWRPLFLASTISTLTTLSSLLKCSYAFFCLVILLQDFKEDYYTPEYITISVSDPITHVDAQGKKSYTDYKITTNVSCNR